MLGVLAGQGKTTLTVYNCVLGVLSGQGKSTSTVHLCIRGGIRSRENHINIIFNIILILLCENKIQLYPILIQNYNCCQYFFDYFKLSGNGSSIVRRSWNPDKNCKKRSGNPEKNIYIIFEFCNILTRVI